MRAWRLAAVSILAWAAGCGGPREAVVETVADGARLEYRLESLTGVRDGDLLRTRLEFAGPPGPLVMEMRFRIGVPTRLESGRFRRQQAGAAALAQEGSVGEISSTFLGGQSDRPSIGGVFMLLGSGGAPLYRVTLPTTQLAGPR